MTRHAFTLTELLIVVAIIIALATLCIPTIQLIKESAGGIRCANQMRGCASGHLGYAMDNRGLLPMANGGDSATEGAWMYAIRNYTERFKVESTGTSGSSRSPLSTRCPSLPPAYMVSTLPQHDWQNGGYGRVSQLATNGGNVTRNEPYDGGDGLFGTRKQFMVAGITFPAQRMLLMHTDLNDSVWIESNGNASPWINPGRAGIWVAGQKSPSGGNQRTTWISFQEIHGKAMPYAFVDGHVQKLLPGLDPFKAIHDPKNFTR